MTASDGGTIGGRPLVSICLKCWNQREFVAEALEGVFSQTYRPLEIVICDDRSTDGSWEYLESAVRGERAAALRAEGVSIVLHRNPVNLGNAGNWEMCCELAHGELLVKADGDDVSLPDRTARIVAAWDADGRRAVAVCHSGWQIGPRGEPYGRLHQVTANWQMGAAMAYSPRLFREFPRLPASALRCCDDVIWGRRALMLGTILEIPDRLVRYRIGSGVTTTFWRIRAQCEFCERDFVTTLPVARADLASLRGPSGEARETEARRLEGDERYHAAKLALVTASRFSERLAAYRRVQAVHRALSVSAYLNLAFLLPRFLGTPMLFAYCCLRNLRWRLQRREGQG